MSTPLDPIDHRQVEAFWGGAVEAGVIDSLTVVPTSVEAFGDSQELADELIALVIEGPKRATAGAAADFEHGGAPPPTVGGLWIAADGHGRARALLSTTEVRIGPMSSVDDAFAWDEGEGDRTRKSWLRDHGAFFRRYLPTIGVEFDGDIPLIFERFDVLYCE